MTEDKFKLFPGKLNDPFIALWEKMCSAGSIIFECSYAQLS